MNPISLYITDSPTQNAYNAADLAYVTFTAPDGTETRLDTQEKVSEAFPGGTWHTLTLVDGPFTANHEIKHEQSLLETRERPVTDEERTQWFHQRSGAGLTPCPNKVTYQIRNQVREQAALVPLLVTDWTLATDADGRIVHRDSHNDTMVAKPVPVTEEGVFSLPRLISNTIQQALTNAAYAVQDDVALFLSTPRTPGPQRPLQDDSDTFAPIGTENADNG